MSPKYLSILKNKIHVLEILVYLLKTFFKNIHICLTVVG